MKKLTRLSLLTAVALIMFVVEAQVPLPIPLPGVKLGLSNIVTVYCVYALGPGSALGVLLARILLGSICTGQLSALAYSLTGGLFALGLACLLRKRELWFVSILSGLAHNVGQVLAAMVLTGTPSIAVYLPVLAAAGMAAGLFTGLCAQYLIKRLKSAEK